MANSKLVCISIIVLTFMLSVGISSAGRMTPKTEKREYEENMTTLENSVKEKATVGNNTVHWRRHSLKNDEAPGHELMTAQDSQNPGDGGVGKWTDDFRPTTPGHSPGAGHGYPPAEPDFSP